jgi:hypothetical protein
MEGAPPVANQIDLFMHFPGVSRNGQVARPVEMDKLSSSEEVSSHFDPPFLLHLNSDSGTC